MDAEGRAMQEQLPRRFKKPSFDMQTLSNKPLFVQPFPAHN
ncbi:MAG: hypothetical protein WAV82_14525 [Methylobacter sp.]